MHGWDSVWFGVVMTLNLAIGQFTPLVALVVVIVFPALSLYIPKLFGLM